MLLNSTRRVTIHPFDTQFKCIFCCVFLLGSDSKRESVGDVFVGKLIMFTWGLKGVELSWVFHPEEEEDNWNQDGIIINSLRLSGNQSVKEDLAVRLNVNGGGEEDVLLQFMEGEKRKSKGVEISIVSRKKLFKVQSQGCQSVDSLWWWNV